MMRGNLAALATLGMMALIFASVISATAASNTISPSGADEQRRTTTANDLKPPECSGVTVTNSIQATGNATGTNANELMLGSAAANTLDGSGGGDCILGGGGNDTLRGSGGGDVLLGGPGDDSIQGGPGTDACHGGDGSDTFTGCETRIQ